MIAEQLISGSILPLQTSDTGEVALELMGELFVRHLPIVNNKQLLGVLSEEDILNFDVNEAIGSYSLSLHKPYVRDNDHIYDIMRLLAEQELTAVPVVDADQNYLGCVTLDAVLFHFAKIASFSEPGSIVVLELSKRDYALTEIARIVESENAAILNLFVSTYPDSSRIDITMKLNRQNIQGVLAAFQRFNYDIKASYQESDFEDSMRERFDALMSYLNV